MKIFCLASLLSVALFGCMLDDSPHLAISPEENTFGSVKIAISVPLSGKTSRFGMQMLRGAAQAVKDLNSGRGINGRKVELIAFDSAKVENPVHLAVDRQAAALIAGYSTSEVRKIIDEAQNVFIPIVIATATADDQVAALPYVFRNAPTDSQQAEALSSYLWYWRQLLRLGVMIDMTPGAEYERNVARAAAQSFHDFGGLVFSVEYNENDLSRSISEILSSNPQAIMVPSGGELGAKIIKILRNAGYRGIICGPDSWDDEMLLSSLAGFDEVGDCVFVSFFSDDNPESEYRDFRAAFFKEYNYEPGFCETQTYDAVKLAAAGLGGASTLNEFNSNWLMLRNYFGAAGIYTMLPKGNIDRTLYINRIYVSGEPFPKAKMIRKFQHSKLATYRND